MTNLNFHRLEDEQQLRFYQMPKVLFTSDTYKGLSLGAKAMYSVLRDRQELSIKNNWVDENGYIYLIFTVENLCELLDISDKTVTKYKRELAKYNLLFEKRVGQGIPNRLYVLKPNYSKADTYLKEEKDHNFKKGYPQPRGVENTKIRNNSDSRNEETPILESEKVRCNDTHFNDTDFSETHSFNLSNENEREKERKSEYIQNQLHEILGQAEINKHILKDNYNAVKRAVESLYYRNRPLEINDMIIPVQQIREDLKELNSFHIDMGLRIFNERSAEQIIRNKISYLAVCIYNAIFDMELKIKNDLRYDGII